MNCAHCGSEVRGLYCNVCGEASHTDSTTDSATGAVVLAGWWRRVGATITDEVILFLPATMLFFLVNAVAGSLAGAFAGIALGGVYMVKLLASPHGQTLGNRTVTTQVRDALTGGAISTQQALKRWGFVALYSVFETIGQPSVTYIVTLIGVIDCLYPLFNARKQTLHDRFAGTLVVIR